MGGPGPVLAYVGLGSNLANPRAQVEGAIQELAELSETLLSARSGLYRSAPLGPPEQPDYVNAVVGLETGLTPHALLRELWSIEARHQRRRDGVRWGPRTLDLDLLLYGRGRWCDALLTVPHPGIAERAFVLYPLHAIAPELDVPGLGPVSRLLAALAGPEIEAL